MKNFAVTFDLSIEAISEEDAYEELLVYLADCVRNADATGFDFKEQEDV